MGEPDGAGADRRDRQGRGVPTRRQRPRRRGPAAVHPLVRNGRVRRHRRPHRQHLRPPPRPQPGAGADRHRQPSRYPANRRQVRRRLWGDGGPRSRAHPQRPWLRDRGAGRNRRLDQRGRLALFPGDGRLWRVHRRVRAGERPGNSRQQRAGADPRLGAAAHRLCRAGAGRRAPGRRLFRGAHRAGACRSASSPARRVSAGTRSPSPARRRMPAPPRCRAATTRWSARRG